MSKKIFINNLNTFVSEQLMAELRNDGVDEEGNPNPDANVMFGTYIDKDSSEKPDGIKKMLKRSKPRLAMKYLSECDLIIYDLHAGNPQDVRLALEALRNTKFEEPPDKTLILVSSLMAWSGTDKNKEEIKTPEQLAAEEAAAKAAAKDDDGGEPKEDQDGSQAGDPPETLSQQDDDPEKEVDSQGNTIQREKEEEEDIPKPKYRPRYKHLPWTEADFKKRTPSEEYQIIKEIEDEVLEFKKEGIKTYVVSAGILYGKGEAIFNSHIKKAWLQDPVRLPYVGDGNNQLPTIHVTDLARIVKKISEAKPERQYIFAVDNNQKPTQKKLINAISNGIGTGLVESIDIPETFKTAHPKLTPIQLDLDWKKSLLLDLKVTPSSLFIKPDAPAGDGEDGGDGPEILELNWHCKSGLAENIQLVKEEFEKKRGLKPVKIFISGPPCSGKSFFGKQLAEHYNVPHIHMEKLLSDIKSWDQEKEDNWRKRVKERDAKIEVIKQEREAEKKRREEEEEKKRLEAQNDDDDAQQQSVKDDGSNKSGDPAEVPPAVQDPGENGEEKKDEEEPINVPLEGDSDDDFTEIEIKEKVIAYVKENPKQKIPMDIITEAVRWRLNRNDCQNRGYILDGITKTFSLAKDVFVITPPAPPKQFDDEGNEIVDEEAKAPVPTLQKNIYPKSVICLNATDQFIRRRSKELLKNKQVGADKWESSKLAEKLNSWNENNHLGLFHQELHGPDTKYPTYKFFQDNETEIFELGANGSAYEIFESMRIYVERFGRPYNYLKSVGKLNQEREDYLVTEEKDHKEAESKKKQDEEVKIREQKLALEKLAEERLAGVMAHMKELEDCDDLNMRQFLMKYIIPLLTEGMIEVWKVGPLDPVDYLADYIFKRSNNVW